MSKAIRRQRLSDFCGETIKKLDATPLTVWAEVWVRQRMRMHWEFQEGRVFTTIHGTGIFEDILNLLGGAALSDHQRKDKAFADFITAYL